MDPNANLKEQLELAAGLADGSAYASDPDYAARDGQRLAELALELHSWIRKGGFLPAAWEAPKPQSKTDIVQELAAARGWEVILHGDGTPVLAPPAQVPPTSVYQDVALSPLITQSFQTSDGYALRWACALRPAWTDGDLVFFSDKDGWPLDDQGQRLEGKWA